MKVNKSKGDMFEGYCTTNPYSGRCKHECDYCFVGGFSIPMLKEKYSGELRLERSVLQGDTGIDQTIMVCSCNDLFQEEAKTEDIVTILSACRAYPFNTYHFQSKNPRRMLDFLDQFPPRAIFATTIETNRQKPISDHTSAPPISERISAMMDLRVAIHKGYPKDARDWQGAIIIEPIMDFDVDELVRIIQLIKPDYVAIGADSRSVEDRNLPEPTAVKVKNLVDKLDPITEVRLKPNLDRIVKLGTATVAIHVE